MLHSKLNEYENFLKDMRLELLVLLENTNNTEALNYHRQAFNNVSFLRAYIDLYKIGGISNEKKK